MCYCVTGLRESDTNLIERRVRQRRDVTGLKWYRYNDQGGRRRVGDVERGGTFQVVLSLT